jgi:BirA family transcriptional regulator, biotin operon repressor / biotin---[acetyl-CoA-carboxylase] ligase
MRPSDAMGGCSGRQDSFLPRSGRRVGAGRTVTGGARRVEEAGRAAFPGFRLRVLERTPSTQDVVRAAARAGAEAGYCCVALVQSAGRGRQGRAWVAAPGAALLVSVLVRLPARVVGGVPLLGGIAVCDAVTALGVAAGVVGVKWPNDVLVRGSGAKLAGVLAEVEPLGVSASPQPARAEGRRDAGSGGDIPVALGIGLNLTVSSFPPGIPGASLHDLVGHPIAWDDALPPLLTALGSRLAELESGGLVALNAAWRAHAVGLGGRITAHTPQGVVVGTALDIADDGALLVQTPHGITRLLAGDVHLDPAGDAAP